MNRVSMTLACAALVFAVQPALASEDVSSELAEMRDMMQGLKQKVEAQEEQLEHQGQLLEQAQGAVKTQASDGSESGLSPFLDMINVGGHIAASYNYNFNTPKSGEGGENFNSGDQGGFLPFHRDADQFSLGQAWFSLGKDGTEESPAFFGFDIVYGQTAAFFGQGISDEDSRREDNDDGTSDYYVHQAYVGYFCDCFGPETMLKFGKWSTLVGAEVAQAPANFNITRGTVYSFLQPVDHMGVLGTINLGMVELSSAIMNSGTSLVSAPDNNKELAYLGSAKIGDDKMNVRGSFIYGNESLLEDNLSRATGLVDVTAWFNPTDNLSTWVNYNYLYQEDSGLYVHGVATAARVGITEKLGAAIRGEYIREHASDSEGVFIGAGNDGPFDPSGGFVNTELYSLTGTVDYSLTDHLIARAEARFDWISDPGNVGDGFFENHDGTADNQTVGLIEVIYTY